MLFCLKLLLVFILSSPLMATVQQISKQKFSIDTKDWQFLKDAIGIPYTVLGPMKDFSRPTILITPTNLKKMIIDFKDAEKSYSQYIEGRKKWLAKKGGKSIKFYPYQKTNWDGILVSHEAGYEYTLNNHNFVEKSFYIQCREFEIFHLKYLLRQDNLEEQKNVEEIIRSFKCDT